jgi:hypothetical protein
VEGEFSEVHIDNPAYIALPEPLGWLLRAFGHGPDGLVSPVWERGV